MKTPKTAPGRRRALARLAGTAAAASGAALLPNVGVSQSTPAAASPPDPSGGTGYQETERVRQYYRLARF